MSRAALQHRTAPSPMVVLSAEYLKAREYLEAIVASTADAICTTDMRGRIVYFSPGAEKMTGADFSRVLGLKVSSFYEGGLREAEAIMRRLIKEGGFSDHETVLLGEGGRRVHISMSASLLRDRAGRVIGTLGISKDITRRVELEKRLRELTITDGLTGLFNHRHFRERAEGEISRAKRSRQRLSLMVMDIDRFKDANDRWGHPEGDRILRETADIIQGSIRKDVDSAFRCGGDEFAVLLPGQGPRTAAVVARRIRASFSGRPFFPRVGLSVGAATLKPSESLEALFKRADGLMYKAKQAGRRNAIISPYGKVGPGAPRSVAVES